MKGLASQAECLLRMSLEALFGLAAIARNDEAIAKLNQSHEFEKQEFAKKLKQWRTTGEHKIDLEALKAIDIDKYSELKITRVSTSSIAKLGNYESWYKNTYMRLSWASHNAINDLEKHLVIKDTEIIGMKNEPQIEDLEFAFCCAIQILINAHNELSEVFKIPVNIKITDFIKQLESLKQLHNL
jgi:Family of unknown function (DUF5677)